jgi:DNA-3-methyladenine glycosylase
VKKLKKDFFIREDVVAISKELLGKYLFTRIDNIITAGIITETEAYAGVTDRASHAYGHRRTKRTEIMYLEGGVAYVYLCYGIHSLFNIVTNKKDIPHAILIRGIKPTHGIETMCLRRNKLKVDKTFSSGPGTLTKSLGIDLCYNNISLSDNIIWIEEGEGSINDRDINIGERIGIDYAKEDAKLPYRFWLDI